MFTCVHVYERERERVEERVRMNERRRETEKGGVQTSKERTRRFEWRNNIGYNGGIMSVGIGSRHEQIIRVIMLELAM